ncbi:hypothetical protein [Bifidobacterium dolichotidis]|nr:hypothetical protein [Bifidobacterium dolichotidis]
MVVGSGSMKAWGGSYVVAANIFRSINYLGLTTMYEWSLVLGVLLTTAIVVFLFFKSELSLLQELFWLACIVLLNIYIFTIGKDVIQFFFFYLVLLAILIPNVSIGMRVSLVAIIFIIEGLSFRSYFMLVAVFFIGIHFLLKYFHSKMDKVSILQLALTVVVFVYFFLIVSSIVFPAEYQSIVGSRANANSAREGSADAKSAIINLIPGNGLLISLINYPISAIRMMIPIELLFRGVSYIPFIIFQILITVFYLRIIVAFVMKPYIKTEYILSFEVFTAFLLVSFFFEPDFGSWVRHEMAAFPVFQSFVFSSYCGLDKMQKTKRFETRIAVQRRGI